MHFPRVISSPVRAAVRFVTTACACMLLPTVVAAHPILTDQTQPYVGGASVNIVTNNLGQTFTPTLTSLEVVELWLMDTSVSHDVTNTLTLNILELDGTLLGSSAPEVFANGYGGGTVALSHFDFAPIALMPGTKYIIGFDVNTTGAYSDLGIASYHPGTYTGGGLWLWSTMTEHPTSDLTFAEGPAASQVPEPASMLVFGIGLLGYASRRCFTPSR